MSNIYFRSLKKQLRHKRLLRVYLKKIAHSPQKDSGLLKACPMCFCRVLENFMCKKGDFYSKRTSGILLSHPITLAPMPGDRDGNFAPLSMGLPRPHVVGPERAHPDRLRATFRRSQVQMGEPMARVGVAGQKGPPPPWAPTLQQPRPERTPRGCSHHRGLGGPGVRDT